jgi:hypothetical protein
MLMECPHIYDYCNGCAGVSKEIKM